MCNLHVAAKYGKNINIYMYLHPRLTCENILPIFKYVHIVYTLLEYSSYVKMDQFIVKLNSYNYPIHSYTAEPSRTRPTPILPHPTLFSTAILPHPTPSYPGGGNQGDIHVALLIGKKLMFIKL